MSKKKRQEHHHQKQQKPAPAPKGNKLIPLLLFVFAFMLYGNTLKHGYLLDDDIVIGKNEFVQQGNKGIKNILTKGSLYGFNKTNSLAYRPVPLVTFALETQYFGNKANVRHFFNVLLYAISCVLLFVLLKKLFAKNNYLIPLLVTLLFMAHPIHTEAVANIKSRDEILVFLTGIISLILLLDYLKSNKISRLIYSLVAYFICLLSKENAVTFLAVIPLTLYFFSTEAPKRIIALSSAYLGVVLLSFMLKRSILDSLFFFEEMDIINNTLMAAKNGSELWATKFVLLGKYLQLLAFPHPLSWAYSYNQIPISNWADLRTIAALLIYSGMFVYAIMTVKKRDNISYGILFYLITISTTCNFFILIGSTIGERFLFTPSLGFCIAIVFLMVKLLKIDPITMKGKKTVLFGITGLVLVSFSFKTIDRNKDWENNFTLFSADVKSSPNSARTHFAVASEYRVAGEKEMNPQKRTQLLDAAIDEYQQALKIYPKYAPCYYNLGVTYYTKGEKDLALEAYTKVLEISPNHKDALNNTGVIHFERKEYDEALKHFLRILEFNSNDGNAMANIGAVHHNNGDYDKAISFYEKAIAINPGNKNVYNNLIKLHNKLGNTEKADYYDRQRSQLR